MLHIAVQLHDNSSTHESKQAGNVCSATVKLSTASSRCNQFVLCHYYNYHTDLQILLQFQQLYGLWATSTRNLFCNHQQNSNTSNIQQHQQGVVNLYIQHQQLSIKHTLVHTMKQRLCHMYEIKVSLKRPFFGLNPKPKV